MGLSEQIADYVIETKYDDLSLAVVNFTKNCIIDYFASAIAGSKELPIQMLKDVIAEQGGHAHATTIFGDKTSTTQAALLNGASSHIVELDDIHKSSIIHAATVVIPAALAIGEHRNVSGKSLILAIVLGYEVCYRIGEVVTPSHYYYWHNTATCGTFGAAIACAKLLDLDKDQIIHTLGSAGTQAAGLWEFIEDGAMSKQLHPGKAAMNGVYSAILAEKGFTGASKILEGKRGFFESMSTNYDIKKMYENLGQSFKITENSFKIHASCRHTHHVMDLVVELFHNKTVAIEDIEKIKIGTYKVALDITDNPNPQTIYASKFSIQYCVALALFTGSGSLRAFNSENLKSKDIFDLIKKTEVFVDEEINGLYPESWGCKLEIIKRDGETIKLQSTAPKGDPEWPLTDIDFKDKFKELTVDVGDYLGLLELITNLDTLSVRDLMSFFK